MLEGDPTLRDTLLDANVVHRSRGDRHLRLRLDEYPGWRSNAKDVRDDTPSTQFAILVRIEDEENVDKVRKLGVDQVISPSTLGGRLLAARAVESAQRAGS